MVELRVMISDTKTGKTYKKILPDANDFLNLKIKDKFSGDLVGLKGFELEITGGSDYAGFPMREDLAGASKRKLLVTKGFGARNIERKGQLGRKTVRGNTVSNETAQINAKILSGKGDLDNLFGVKKEEPAAETAAPA